MKAPPPPLWLLSLQGERRRAAIRFWINDPLVGGYKIGAYALLRLMPIDWGSAVGKRLALITAPFYRPSETRARRLWKHIHPDQDSETAADAFVRRLWGNVGRTMAEIPMMERIWDAGRVEVTGLEHLKAERAAGRPVIVAAMHLGNWELLSVGGVKNGLMGASLALVLDNRFEQRLVGKLREEFGGRMVHATWTNGKAIVEEIVERGPLVIYVDDYSRGRVHAPAFGRPLQAKGNIAYVPRLARLTGASVVMAYCLRQGDACRFRATILPPLRLEMSGEPGEDLAKNVATINALIEPIIAENLDQWFYALDLDLEK